MSSSAPCIMLCAYDATSPSRKPYRDPGRDGRLSCRPRDAHRQRCYPGSVRLGHRFRPASRPGGTEEVLLFGEASDWINPIPLVAEGDGTFSAPVELPVGVYQYKLRVGATWAL